MASFPEANTWINPYGHRCQIKADLTAGCIDTDLAAGRRNFGQPNKPLIAMAQAHYAM
jgi:hypothetical protein